MVLDLASLPRWAVAGIAHLIFLDGSPRACLVDIPAAWVKGMPVWPRMTAEGQSRK
jgi:hypothetical protein